MSKGKVWLVGAGPGDIGLMTLKSVDVLKNADVIVYDHLIGDAILSRLPEDRELICVGKQAGNHTMPQDEINRLLLEKALDGKNVARLKGGDPFLFGRGGEELELLVSNNIPYEVVPAVTSVTAVPAYNGIPVTHRDHTSSLHIITGHKKQDRKYDIDFQALVKCQGTLVFLMGLASLPFICRGLLDAGMDPDTPAAVLQRGTTADQKRVSATVSNLEIAAKKEKISTPAIIVVGDVCALADKFSWYEKLPLAGWRVLVTRPMHLTSALSHKLRLNGAEVIEMPSIRTIPMDDQKQLDDAINNMGIYRWIVFTSPTGVRVFFDEMMKTNKDIRALANVKIAAIGSGSASELLLHDLRADFMPSVYDGDTLGIELAQKICPGDNVLIPRALKGNENLVRHLSEAGAEVDDVSTYRTVYSKSHLIDEADAFAENKIDCAVFSSSSTVMGFVESTPGLDYSKVKAACIGKQTKATADSFGMETYIADNATIDDLVNLVKDMKNKGE